MPSSKRQPKTHRPYLATTEFMEVFGITRKTLRNYEAAGIITPVYFENDFFKYWTLEQANDVMVAQLLNHDGMSLPQIAQLIEAGDKAMIEHALAVAARNAREARRTLKNLAIRQRRLDDYLPIESRRGMYLRYLPQRCFVLIPLPTQTLPNDNDYIHAHDALKRVIGCVGWGYTFSQGTLYSVQDGKEHARYLFIGLSSPALPSCDNNGCEDCGCYAAFCEAGDAACSAEQEDELRSRFGRKPSEQDFEHWKAFEKRVVEQGADLQAYTLFADEESTAQHPGAAHAPQTRASLRSHGLCPASGRVPVRSDIDRRFRGPCR